MSSLAELIDKGGPAIVAIMTLSVVLYWRCFTLLLVIRRSQRDVKNLAVDRLDPTSVLRLQEDMRESFRQHRVALGAMIAAAPLLGLLGTVSGMVTTFESLAQRAGEKSMEGLANGISEVLVATASGLLVALPALLLVFLAHREVLRYVQQLNATQVESF